jgi:hypothetical protein
MIKLKQILLEGFPKYKYIRLSQSDINTYKEELFDLISGAYKSKGGYSGLQNANDIANGEINVWYAADIDKDPNLDITLGGKEKSHGTKLVVVGQDGSPEAKKYIVNKMKQLLRKRGFYSEMDLELAQKFNAPIIKDEELIKAIIQKTDIKFTGDGKYTRNIDGIPRTKVLVGMPE